MPASTRGPRPAVQAGSAAEAIVQALAEAGTRLMFGVPGGGPNLDVVGAAGAAGLRFILARGETAAVIMAATYADLTGTPGTTVVTRGPGLATALAAALRRPGPTVIDASVDPADYLAVMDLSRGQAGRRSGPGTSRAPQVRCPLTAFPGSASAKERTQ